jgi:Flp pilus assembly protein TadB
VDQYHQKMAQPYENEQRSTVPGGLRLARLAVRAVLWGIALTLAAITAWIVWAVVMSGGGLTLALCALALAAPWPLFYFATSRRTRSSRTGRTKK